MIQLVEKQKSMRVGTLTLYYGTRHLLAKRE